MKARNVFALLGLTFAMGAGVFAGVSSKKAEEVGAATTSVTVAGSFNGWSTTADPLTLDGDYWSIEKTLAVDDTFKLVVNGSDWVGDGDGVTWCAGMGSEGKGNNFKCLTAGTYIIKAAKTIGDYGNKSYGVFFEVSLPDPEYHLLGSFNSWEDPHDDYIMTVDAGDANHYTFSDIELEEGGEVKVKDVVNNIWYGDHGSNVIVPEDGTYDVDFYVHADNEVNVVLNEQITYSVHCGYEDFDFELYETDKPEGVVHQYRALVDYAYRARELTFFRNGVQITSNIGVDYQDDQPKPGNNIVGDVTNGFKVYYPFWSGMEVYLKTYSDGGISLWANGYKEVSFNAAVKNGKGGASLIYFNIDEDFEPYGDYIKQFKTSSKVKLVGLSGEDWDTSNSFSCGGDSDSIHIENVPGNNAKEAFQSDAWTVHNDCEEVVFVKMKSDLSMHMYIGGYVEEHVLTIGGEEIPMVKYDEEQYYATGVNLSAGDVVTSYKIEGVEKNPTSKAVGNNNLLNNEVLVDNASADIYYNVSDNNLYVSGLPLGGYHIYKNGNSIIQMTETDPFGDYTQHKTDLTTFAVGDYFKFIDCSGGSVAPVLFSITKINEGGLGANFEVVGDPGSEVIRCKTACSTAVYMKLLSGLDEVYFGDVPEEVAAAKEYADGFKTAMAAACSSEPSGKEAAVKAAWALQATEYKNIGDAKTREAIQNVLKASGSSSVAELREFAERYAAFQEKYSAWELENFLEWDLVPAPAHISDVNHNVDNTALIAIISVITLTSVSSIAVLLVIKKRKHN